jgi:hypothetical protein
MDIDQPAEDVSHRPSSEGSVEALTIEQIKPDGKDDHQDPEIVPQGEKPPLEKGPDIVGEPQREADDKDICPH